MQAPQVIMIICLTLSFVAIILRGVSEKAVTSSVIAAIIKVIFLSAVLYCGGFWGLNERATVTRCSMAHTEKEKANSIFAQVNQ